MMENNSPGITDRTVLITGRILSDLEGSAEVAQWITNNLETFNSYMGEYNKLIDRFNNLPSDDPILELLPQASSLKDSLNGNRLPHLEEMAEGNYPKALVNAKPLIIKGQEINRGRVEATEEEKLLAIGTPSYITSSEARAVGTAAHAAERTFFEWAKKNSNILEEKWEKDDWLHGLKDILILMEAEGIHFKLTELFLKPNNVDGLGWMKKEEFERKKQELQSVINP